MQNITQIFTKKLMESKHLISFKEEDLLRNKIEKYEEKFAKYNFFVKYVYNMQPKYYLQNKNKTDDLTDIQEYLRDEIKKLNKLYPNNFYFIKIEKSVLAKNENKHIYNVFNISKIEYIMVNLLDDIINESDVFYSGDMKPFTFANLPLYYKEMIYELIDDALNVIEMYVSYDDENDFKYHNNFMFYLRNIIFNFFVDLYKSKSLLDLRKMILDLDGNLSLANYINIQKTIDYYNGKDKYAKKIDKIMDKIIICKLDITSNILNYVVLEEIIG